MVSILAGTRTRQRADTLFFRRGSGDECSSTTGEGRQCLGYEIFELDVQFKPDRYSQPSPAEDLNLTLR